MSLARNGFTLLNRVPFGKFNRVKMNIPDQLQQIGFFLAQYGFACTVKSFLRLGIYLRKRLTILEHHPDLYSTSILPDGPENSVAEVIDLFF